MDYHQFKLAKKSSKVIAIIHPTPWGFYQFLVCPFGILTAPGEYQAGMAHVVLKEFYLNGAIVYIDDAVIYGSNVEEFMGVRDRILSQMEKFNVRLKPSKYFLESLKSSSWVISLKVEEFDCLMQEFKVSKNSLNQRL